jgi:deoxyribodipyrimidine photo-lyase
VPELAAIEGAEVHAADARRARAPDYPAPIVDLADSRAAALTAYDRLRTP